MQPEQMPGRSHAQIADHNSRTILEALRRNGPMTRVELAALTGLTTAGVNNVLRRQVAEGLVSEGGHRRTPNAQVPSAEYALRPEGAFAIGMRIKPDVIEALLVDLSGHVHARETSDHHDDAVEKVIKILSDVAGPSANIVGIGIASPIEAPADIAGFRDAMPETPVIGELDTIAAALCERTFGGDIPENGLVMVLLEDHIRSCLLLHSVPFAGVRGRAGRIGEMHTGRDRRRLDEACSSAVFAKVAGDTALQQWISTAAEHLLDALMAIGGFVAPGRIVLAGDIPAPVMQALMEAMRSLWDNQTTESPPPALPKVVLAAKPHESVLIGAAFLPFFHRLLPKATPT